MGLLDAAMQGAPQPGGLLGQAAPSSAGLQMAQMLAQNPTPQVAQQIIMRLHQMGNPQAQHFEQALTQAMGSPAALKQIADTVIQKLGGANA